MKNRSGPKWSEMLEIVFYHTQVTDTEDVDGNAEGEACASDVENQAEVRSTKRPLSQTSSSGKKRKKSNPEDELLQKAIDCMETAIDKPSMKTDEYDLFGKFIAAELRAMENVQARCWEKLQMQTILFNVQTGMRSMRHYTVKPPKKGQYEDGPFVPSREVVLFWRFSLLHVNIAKYEALLQF